jgi:hypothetical protein
MHKPELEEGASAVMRLEDEADDGVRQNESRIQTVDWF